MSAYNGKDKYLFISYAHKDAELVLPLIDGLSVRGVRLWYDEGIEVGTEWAEFIEERILGCEALVLFLSRASIESINCREEFALAREADKKILICYLEELAPSELKHGLRLRVPSYQCVFLTRHPSAVSLLDEICRARILEGCIDAPVTASTPPVSEPEDESPMARDERLESLQRAEVKPKPTATAAPSIPTPAPSISEPAPSIPEPAPSISTPAPSIPTPAPTAVAPSRPKKPEEDIKYSEGLEIGPLGLLKGIGTCRDEVVVVPWFVRSVERGAFKNCKKIKEIILPENVQVIPGDVFSGCVNLERVTVSKYLRNVGARAFLGCVRLESINLPANTQFIHDRAFMNCKSLYLGWIPANLIELGERAFFDCALAQGMFSTRIRKIGHLALGRRKATHASAVKFNGTPEEWAQVQRDGKIMSCRVQYVECADGKQYVFE